MDIRRPRSSMAGSARPRTVKAGVHHGRPDGCGIGVTVCENSAMVIAPPPVSATVTAYPMYAVTVADTGGGAITMAEFSHTVTPIPHPSGLPWCTPAFTVRGRAEPAILDRGRRMSIRTKHLARLAHVSFLRRTLCTGHS